ncbi:MAG: hypothetical protein GXX10_05080 [Clostridiaceae bacterium]|nr:hypothetical protein [Clostridiaceae bacterium]
MTFENTGLSGNEKITYDRLFKLSAVLYADVGSNKSYNVRLNTVINKLVKSIFVEVNNQEMSITQIIKFSLDNYSIMLDESEVKDVVYNNDEYLVIKGSDGSTFISLKQSEYDLIKTKVKNSSINSFIDIFIASECPDEDKNIKDIIYRFLYELYSTNVTSFMNLIKCKVDCFDFESININSNDYSETEKNIIIRFLNWDNPQKNKAIFDIVSYGIEFCLICSKSDFNNVLGKGIKNKIFYLDTNIIYRALGINGEDRQILTNIFLDKCSHCGVTLRISKYTEEEFKNSINFHITKLSKYKTINIDPSYFDNPDVNPGIYKFYHLWRKGRIDTNLEKFKHYIFSQFYNLCQKFNISFDYKQYFDENNTEVKLTLKNYCGTLQNYKKDDLEYVESRRNYYDAANILLVESARGNKHSTFLDTKHYIISSDQALRRWDYDRKSFPSVVLLPTQWLSILLRYTGRSEDDYRSFVSFINLKMINTIDDEMLHMICAGINEMTMDIKQQKIVMDTFLENNINDFFNKTSSHYIYEESKTYAKNVLESQLKEALELASAAEEEVSIKEKEIDSLKRKYLNDLEKINSMLFDEKSKRYNQIINIKNKVDRSSKIIVTTIFAVIYFIILTVMILLFKYLHGNWDIIEPIIFIGTFLLLGNAVFFDNKLSLTNVKHALINRLKNKKYKKANLDLTELENLKNDLEL